MLNLLIEGKHYEGSVYHIINAVGTVGGIFELVSNGIMILYFLIHKDLYMHSILNSLSKIRKYQTIFSMKPNSNQNHIVNERYSENEKHNSKASESK